MNIKRIIKIKLKNHFDINNKWVKTKGVKVEWWNEKVNLGDAISPLVVDWVLKQKELKLIDKGKTIHLSAIGSIIGMGLYDSTIWGSGILNFEIACNVIKNRKFIKYDIRALRGPLTKMIMEKAGYNCENVVLSDPAILMPLIYKPNINKKKYKYTLIMHHESAKVDVASDVHILDIKTNDYKFFIDEIIESEVVISESLHGIILAEAYGIKAIYLNSGITEQILKFIDYYYSTNRYNIKIVSSIEEAKRTTPMCLPNLKEMQKKLIDSFPEDICSKY